MIEEFSRKLNTGTTSKSSITVKTNLIILPVILCGFSIFFTPTAYGDGLAAETLPPVLVGNSNVTLSVGGTGPSFDLPNAERQVNFKLSDPAGNPIPDVTFAITITKDGKPLLGHVFKEKKGTLTLIFIKNDDSKPSLSEEQRSIFNPYGEDNTDYVYGKDFSEGLYRFHIMILSAYSLDLLANPINYSVNISIPQYNNYQIYEPNSGNHTVTIIGYYDKIRNFTYNSSIKSINFEMPFDWSDNSIKQVSVVHQEIRVPNNFGDFMVTKYDAYVNDIKLPDKTVAIDDYSSNTDRVIHLILYKSQVAEIAKMLQNPSDSMSFKLMPSEGTAFPVTHYSQNGQYIVNLSWNPPKILAGSNTTFSFRILDPYSMNKTVLSTNYNFNMIVNNKTIFNTSGISSRNNDTVVIAQIAQGITGPVTIALENLGGNNRYAEADFSSMISSPSIPEFPSGMMIVLFMMFSIIILFSRFQYNLTI